MPYKIIKVDAQSIPHILNFQIKTIPLLKSFAGITQDLNNRPPEPAFKKTLEDSVGRGMLYEAVSSKNSKEIFGFMVGYSPGAAPLNRRLQQTFQLLQGSFKVPYFMLIQALFKPGIDQQELFMALLDKVLERARYFEFAQAAFPVQGNEYLEDFISRCTEFDLASTADKEGKGAAPIVFRSFVKK